MKRQTTNILILFLIFALTVMPFTAMAADGSGESGVKIIPQNGSNALDGGIQKVDDTESADTDTDTSFSSDGFNELLRAPITGVDYVMSMSPLKKAVMLFVGFAIGISIIITVIAFAANNGRIGWGSIFGKYSTMLQGRNAMLFVFMGFLGFLLALALMKYVGTTGIF